MKNRIVTSLSITTLIIFNIFIAFKYYQNTEEYSKIKNTYYSYLIEKKDYETIKNNEETIMDLYNKEMLLKQSVDEYENKNNILKNEINTIQNKINEQ